jgi:hypothetical protein
MTLRNSVTSTTALNKARMCAVNKKMFRRDSANASLCSGVSAPKYPKSSILLVCIFISSK